MQLEAGKKYTDRRGRVYGPLVRVDVSCGGLFGENREDYAWYGDGQRSPGRELPSDLVAEYVEPVQPDNRVPAGEGYRLLSVGEAEQKGDQWFDRVKGQWREACLINAKTNKNDLIQGYSIRRKVEPAAPVESPDDWVILDPVVYADHVPRVGIDQFQGWDDNWTTQEYFHSKDTIGKWHTATGGNQTRCRRKDLPPVPPAEPEFPQYIIYATGGTFADCAYIVRTSEDDAYSVLANGKRGVDFKWVAYKANSLKSGVWKRVTEKEAEKLVKKTRTVVLKEWLCWEDAEPETVTLHWCSTSPADETDQFSAWNNAVETGNTRTVEIPVT